MTDATPLSPTAGLIRLEVEDGIARLTLNQPQTLNAITRDLALELHAHLAALTTRGDVRALVVSGAGRAFMAGGDLKYLQAAGREAAPAQAEGVITPFHDAMRLLAALPFPVVAKVHGSVAGAGLSIMLACDYAMAADGTRFAFAYSRIATNPDGGLSWLLPRAIGVNRAMRFAFIDDVIGTEAALAVGLIFQSVPADALDAAVDALAGTLATKPTRAFAETKRLMRGTFERSLDAQLDAEREGFCRNAGTRDFHEGITAFFEKRPAAFEGR